MEHRHEVLSIIKSAYDVAAACDDKVTWDKGTVCALARYVKLDDVYKLRACYLVAQEDPSVIVHDDGTMPMDEDGDGTATEAPQEADVAEEARVPKLNDFFHWAPQNLMEPYLKDKKNKEAQNKLFSHMTNFTAQMMWDADKNQAMEPSAYLDTIMSDDQKQMLCPSYKNVLTGYILYDVKGKGAVNKLAKRRLDMISGNVASYARCLNSTKRLKQIQEVNELVATVAEVSADIEKEKTAQKVKALEKKDAAVKKKSLAEAKEKIKRQSMLPGLKFLMEDFISGRRRIEDFFLLPKQQHQHILKHYYELQPKGWTNMNKEQLHKEIVKAFEAAKAVTDV